MPNLQQQQEEEGEQGEETHTQNCRSCIMQRAPHPNREENASAGCVKEQRRVHSPPTQERKLLLLLHCTTALQGRARKIYDANAASADDHQHHCQRQTRVINGVACISRQLILTLYALLLWQGWRGVYQCRWRLSYSWTTVHYSLNIQWITLDIVK